MRRNAFAAAVWLLVATAVSSQTPEELNNDGTDTDHVLTYGMGYHQHRYSPLTQVNKQTVRRLVPVASLHQFGDARQEQHAAVGRSADARGHRGLVGVRNGRGTAVAAGTCVRPS
jgi:glucose dehydrogenase